MICLNPRRTVQRRDSRTSRNRLASPNAQTSQPRRAGLTLFEVLISLVIFVGSMTAIGQLVSNGVRGALQSRYQTEAAMLCEAKLAEVVAGIVPLQSAEGVFVDDNKWSWTLVVAVGPAPGLMRADVTVKRTAANSKAVVSFNMARYVRDPQLYYAAEQEAAQNAADQGTTQ